MAKLSDIEFYRVRIEQELERARMAPDERIARIHAHMAERYGELLTAALTAADEDSASARR